MSSVMLMVDKQLLLRQLPAVHEVLQTETAQRLMRDLPRSIITEAVRKALDKIRQQVLSGDGVDVPSAEKVAQFAVSLLWREVVPLMPRVINATGIIVHTGLGRSLLSQRAVKRLVEVATHLAALKLTK